MAVVDFNERQINLKLVYYGPPLSGKTTNLKALHARVDKLNRGRLLNLETRDDRTLFFDLLPVFFRLQGLSFRVKVYTVPGQPMHSGTRRVVLTGADGVAFIADSSIDCQKANEASYNDLMDNVAKVGLDRERLPVVTQFNKRDLPDAVATEELLRSAPWAGPSPQLASALTGQGVIDTFFTLLQATWVAVDRELQIEQGFGIQLADFLKKMREHVLAEDSHSDAAS